MISQWKKIVNYKLKRQQHETLQTQKTLQARESLIQIGGERKREN